ncbi:hypothetical protein [Actinoallomurus sp. CA-142502]|uniref:hypothetical protein n=1 Tax=Actinoallomurus sp. CA-142502 TaxID=3239885 RepID=UPI003D919AFB
MTSWISMHGTWRVTVVRKASDWPQRVVITGSVQRAIPGTVGASETVSGIDWHLTIEHDLGGAWRQSEFVQAGPVREYDGRAARTVASKDHYWQGDSDPNDLVLRLEHVGARFEVTATPHLVDGLGRGDDRYLAVTIRNTGYRAFDYDTVLDVTDRGRNALARQGIVVAEIWTPEALRATGQEAYGRGAVVRPLEVGAEAVVHFPARRDTVPSVEAADIEFLLSSRGGGSRGTVRERRLARMVPTAARPARKPNDALRVAGDSVDVRARAHLPVHRSAPSRAPESGGQAVIGWEQRPAKP